MYAMNKLNVLSLLLLGLAVGDAFAGRDKKTEKPAFKKEKSTKPVPKPQPKVVFVQSTTSDRGPEALAAKLETKLVMFCNKIVEGITEDQMVPFLNKLENYAGFGPGSTVYSAFVVAFYMNNRNAAPLDVSSGHILYAVAQRLSSFNTRGKVLELGSLFGNNEQDGVAFSALFPQLIPLLESFVGSSIESIQLYNNNLVGNVPEELFTALGQLRELVVSNNKLTGDVPVQALLSAPMLKCGQFTSNQFNQLSSQDEQNIQSKLDFFEYAYRDANNQIVFVRQGDSIGRGQSLGLPVRPLVDLDDLPEPVQFDVAAVDNLINVADALKQEIMNDSEEDNTIFGDLAAMLNGLGFSSNK